MPNYIDNRMPKRAVARWTECLINDCRRLGLFQTTSPILLQVLFGAAIVPFSFSFSFSSILLFSFLFSTLPRYADRDVGKSAHTRRPNCYLVHLPMVVAFSPAPPPRPSPPEKTGRFWCKINRSYLQRPHSENCDLSLRIGEMSLAVGLSPRAGFCENVRSRDRSKYTREFPSPVLSSTRVGAPQCVVHDRRYN